jgi:hypothetical protein
MELTGFGECLGSLWASRYLEAGNPRHPLQWRSFEKFIAAATPNEKVNHKTHRVHMYKLWKNAGIKI